MGQIFIWSKTVLGVTRNTIHTGDFLEIVLSATENIGCVCVCVCVCVRVCACVARPLSTSKLMITAYLPYGCIVKSTTFKCF